MISLRRAARDLHSTDGWQQCQKEGPGPIFVTLNRSSSPFAAISIHHLPRLQKIIQDVEAVFEQARVIFRAGLHRRGGDESGSLALKSRELSEVDAVTLAKEAEAARKEKLTAQLAAWHSHPQWVDQPPNIKVTAPPGSFCDLYCNFTIGLPPEAVYDILCDPDNHRVFKNIKEVKTRDVLEDKGSFQRVLVEQTAIWRFLWLSGTFEVFMDVATDKTLRQISYRLAKGGFMKRFEGKWEIEPLPVPAQLAPAATFPAALPAGEGGRRVPSMAAAAAESEGAPERVAAQVTLRQRLQPAVRLPPPISNYVRGISAAATKSMLADLQAEARRVREGRPIIEVLAVRSRWTEPAPLSKAGANLERADHTRKGGLSTSRRRKGDRFRQKLRQR